MKNVRTPQGDFFDSHRMLHAAVLPYMIICQKRCSVSYKVWQCVNWKYCSNSY